MPKAPRPRSECNCLHIRSNRLSYWGHLQRRADQQTVSLGSSIGLFACQYELGDGLELHVGCALVDLPDLRIAPVLLDRVVLGKPVSTVDFDRQRGDALGHLGTEEFSHGCFFDEVHAGVFHAGGVVNHEPRRFDFGGHLCQLELYTLEIRYGFAELLPLLCVPAGVFPRATGDAGHLRSNADSALVKGFNRDPVAFSWFSEHVCAWHTAILQEQLASGRSANTELVLFFSNGEPWKILLNDERRNSLVPSRRINAGEQNEDASFLSICNPELPAVQHIVAPLYLRPGLECERVGTRSSLTERIGPDRVAGHLGQVPLFLFVTAPAQECIVD